MSADIIGHPNARALTAAIAAWPQTADCTLQLINYSENHTFRLDGPDGPRFCLRVHRPFYQSEAAIRSELMWLDLLNQQPALNLARPILGQNGDYLQHLDVGGGALRPAVLFAFAKGREPQSDDDLSAHYQTLGCYAAIIHRQTEQWQKPDNFERQHWSAAHILDADGLWGNWRVAPGVDEPIRTILQQADVALRTDLKAYGTASHRYGLIHADMRFGNVLTDGDCITLIDFDDCGFCWFAYEFAAAISFYETHRDVPRWKANWLLGYQKIRPLDAADIAAMDIMVLLRRMALLAWIGSHSETGLAQTHMPGFAQGTADLAKTYLNQRRVPLN